MRNLILFVSLIAAAIIIVVIITFIQIMSTKSQNQQAQSNNTSSTEKLVIKDIKIGTGKAVVKGDTVVINYVGKLTNGKVFDSSYSRGTPFVTQIGVGQVIKGWDEGIPGMKPGGERELIIPGNLAYGSTGIPGTIPPNATLIFDVALVSIK